jgi:hypothetical protein
MALFENAQWNVTKAGLESKGPYGCFIGAAQLLVIADRGGGEAYDWPEHMAAKGWVKIEAFLQAFWWAIDFHADKYGDDLDLDMLHESFDQARTAARGYQRYDTSGDEGRRGS